MQIPSHARPPISSHHALLFITRIQIVNPLMFANRPLRDGKPVLVTQPGEDVPRYHLGDIVVFVVDGAVCYRCAFLRYLRLPVFFLASRLEGFRQIP